MRCNKCNVDLGEEYKKCPLCGEPAVNSEPLIKGQRTAEYPDIVYKKNPPWYFGIFVAVFFAASVLAMAADYILNKTVTNAMWVVFTVPCVWTLVFRPIFIKKLYFGSYIIHDVVCLSLLMLWYSKSHLGYYGPAVRFGLPLLSIAAVLILFAGLFFFPKRRTNAVAHFIALGTGNLVLLIICMALGYSVIWSAVAAALSCILLAVLGLAIPKAVKNELAARFHV